MLQLVLKQQESHDKMEINLKKKFKKISGQYLMYQLQSHSVLLYS